MRTPCLLPERPAGTLEFVVRERDIRGKRRHIAVPSPALKKLSHKFKDLLEEHAGGISISPTRNMLAHAGGRYFFQTDLADAFPSISTKRLAGVLLTAIPRLGTYDEVADFLARYCTTAPEGGLAQGAPASPLLFELYCRHCVDSPIRALLKAQKGMPSTVTYTRYVDDLTFSSNEEFGLQLREKIKKILRGAGFCVKSGKTTHRERGVGRIAITGGILLPGSLPVHTLEFYRSFERQLDLFLRGGLLSTALPSLRGNIAWFEELEERVHGTRRNRQVRRLLVKTAQAQEGLKKLKEEQGPKGGARYRFPKEWLAMLKQKVPIVEYLRNELPYTWAPKAVGIKCPCPFCKTRASSFTASPVKQSFHCYKCKRHGDVIQFVRLQMGWDFVTATVYLAKRKGINLPEEYYRRFGTPVQLTLFD